MNHVWGLFAHPNREMSVIKSENETISHHYTHHVLLMAAVPVVCAFIGTTQLGWNFGDGTIIKLSMLTGLALALRLHGQWIDASIQLTSALGGGYHQTVK